MKRQLLSDRMSQLLRQLPVYVLLLSLAAAAGYAWTRPALATSHIFANSGQILGGETGNGVALGDLDGDGDLDAFVANDHTTFGEANQVWFNEGDGTFTAGQTMGSADGHDVALGDLDGDGDLDALVVGIPPTSLLTARVWLNVGGAQGGVEGTFDGGPTFGSETAYGVALGDVDGDGDLDALLVGNSNQVWLNNGNSTFSAGPVLPFLFSEDAVLADLDDDGWLDALIVDSAAARAAASGGTTTATGRRAGARSRQAICCRRQPGARRAAVATWMGTTGRTSSWPAAGRTRSTGMTAGAISARATRWGPATVAGT